MYIPKGGPSLLMLLLRWPFLVVPIAIGVALALSSVQNVPESMITFSFDDGYISTYTRAYPILAKYGFFGTVFVITSKVGESGYMNSEQIKDLYHHGWEIGSHSVTHPYLTKLSDEEIIAELENSKIFLEKLGIKVYSFASPYGDWNERTLNLISKYYFAHRTSWPPGLNKIPLAGEDRYKLKAVSIEAKTTVEEVKQWIIKAKKEHKWLILIFHRIDENGRYNWSSKNLEEIVKFAHRQGFGGVPLSLLLQAE